MSNPAPPQQLSFVPAREPEEIIAEAVLGQRVVASFCLFSGGNDSKVVAHRLRDHYEALFHIDTGTAAPGVQDFCREYAEWLGKPLTVYTTPPATYREIVLGSDRVRTDGKSYRPLGFPGPAQHQRAYNKLKSDRVEELIRHCKVGHPRDARVMLLSGIRRHESARRWTRPAITRRGGQLWVSPLIDWTSRDMWDYRDAHLSGAPTNDVAALLHRSGECNCGAFASAGERETLIALYPEWWAETMAPLEREAEAAGLKSPRWGSYDPDAFVAPEDVGEMCTDCQLRMEAHQ